MTLSRRLLFIREKSWTFCLVRSCHFIEFQKFILHWLKNLTPHSLSLCHNRIDQNLYRATHFSVMIVETNFFLDAAKSLYLHQTIVKFGTKKSPSIKDGIKTLSFVEVCIGWMERLWKSSIHKSNLVAPL